MTLISGKDAMNGNGDALSGFHESVVVNNKDPLGIGRLQCRIPGIYDDIPDDCLPWSAPLLPVDFGTQDEDEQGHKSFSQWKVPRIGTKVVIVFPNRETEKDDIENTLYIGRLISTKAINREVVPEGSDPLTNQDYYGWSDPLGNYVTVDLVNNSLKMHFKGHIFKFNADNSVVFDHLGAGNTVLTIDAVGSLTTLKTPLFKVEGNFEVTGTSKQTGAVTMESTLAVSSDITSGGSISDNSCNLSTHKHTCPDGDTGGPHA